MKDKLVWKIRNCLYVISMGVMLFTLIAALPQGEVSESDTASSEFWPADFLPHPHLPGTGPKKTDETDMA